MTTNNTPQQKKININLEQMHDHSMCFFDSFGRLIAEWSAIERAFYTWFASVSGMKEGMARSIFYSGKSFNSRADMLEAAFGNQSNMPPLDLDFIKASLKKARAYSAFRNSVVHGEPTLDILHNYSPQADLQLILTQGKDFIGSSAITIDDLDAGLESFSELKGFLHDMFPKNRKPDANLEEYLRRVRELPNPPNSRKTRSAEEFDKLTPDEQEEERQRIIRFRAMAGMGQGAGVRVRARKSLPPQGG
jgi:hypothetical protein